MQFHCKKMSQYFPKLYEPFGGDINVKTIQDEGEGQNSPSYQFFLCNFYECRN